MRASSSAMLPKEEEMRSSTYIINPRPHGGEGVGGSAGEGYIFRTAPMASGLGKNDSLDATRVPLAPVLRPTIFAPGAAPAEHNPNTAIVPRVPVPAPAVVNPGAAPGVYNPTLMRENWNDVNSPPSAPGSVHYSPSTMVRGNWNDHIPGAAHGVHNSTTVRGNWDGHFREAAPGVHSSNMERGNWIHPVQGGVHSSNMVRGNWMHPVQGGVHSSNMERGNWMHPVQGGVHSSNMVRGNWMHPVQGGVHSSNMERGNWMHPVQGGVHSSNMVRGNWMHPVQGGVHSSNMVRGNWMHPVQGQMSMTRPSAHFVPFVAAPGGGLMSPPKATMTAPVQFVNVDEQRQALRRFHNCITLELAAQEAARETARKAAQFEQASHEAAAREAAQVTAAIEAAGKFSFNRLAAREVAAPETGGSRISRNRQVTSSRAKWTDPELHNKFMAAVAQLGGLRTATAATIMNLMERPDITKSQVRSYLQRKRKEESKLQHTRQQVTIDPNAESDACGSEASFNAN